MNLNDRFWPNPVVRATHFIIINTAKIATMTSDLLHHNRDETSMAY